MTPILGMLHENTPGRSLSLFFTLTIVSFFSFVKDYDDDWKDKVGRLYSSSGWPSLARWICNPPASAPTDQSKLKSESEIIKWNGIKWIHRAKIHEWIMKRESELKVKAKSQNEKCKHYSLLADWYKFKIWKWRSKLQKCTLAFILVFEHSNSI